MIQSFRNGEAKRRGGGRSAVEVNEDYTQVVPLCCGLALSGQSFGRPKSS